MKDFLLWVLLILVVISGIYNFILQNENNKLTKENIVLAPNETHKSTIYKDRIVFQTRIKEVVKTEIKYIPPESKVEITTTDQNITSLKYKKFGFCIEPSLSGIVSETFQIGFATRFIYFNRYGLGLGISSNLKPYAYLDRRISDFIPFMNNTTIGVSYDGNIGLIISVFL